MIEMSSYSTKNVVLKPNRLGIKNKNQSKTVKNLCPLNDVTLYPFKHAITKYLVYT